MTDLADLIAKVEGAPTMDDFKTWHMRERQHLNGGKEWFGYIHQCVEQPRLSRLDKYTRKDRGVHSTWRVDGQAVESIEAALTVLATPPVVSPEEIVALTRWRDDFDGAWADRGKDYALMSQLDNKGLLAGKKGVTESGLALLRSLQAGAQN